MINLFSPFLAPESRTAVLVANPNPEAVKKSPLSKKVELGMNSLVILMGIFIAFVILAFLIHSNANATKGYDLRALEHRRTQLLQQKEILSMQVDQVRSLAAISSDDRVQRMVRAEKPLFVGEESVFASR